MQLSPQNELYLEQVVAGGLFPSKEAAMDAAVAALREKTEQIPLVDDEHMEAVEQGLQEADAGLTKLMTDDDWARLSRRITEIAGRREDDRGSA